MMERKVIKSRDFESWLLNPVTQRLFLILQEKVSAEVERGMQVLWNCTSLSEAVIPRAQQHGLVKGYAEVLNIKFLFRNDLEEIKDVNQEDEIND